VRVGEMTCCITACVLLQLGSPATFGCHRHHHPACLSGACALLSPLPSSVVEGYQRSSDLEGSATLCWLSRTLTLVMWSLEGEAPQRQPHITDTSGGGEPWDC
jgi:hypothetical protein